MNIKNFVLSAVKDYKIELSEEQLNQLQRYFELLVSWNEKINLTAITQTACLYSITLTFRREQA